jgi:hypothetical protein
MNSLDNNNEIFKLAVDLVNQSNRNIFLTGKAGTGKTTFLRYIREHSLKQTAVVAPTGVAAINAGGSTIHSFFQLPFSPYLPEARGFMNADATNKHTLLGKIKLNRERIKVLQQLELLIIDEISMVRCDVLDAIDVVLKHFRHRHAEPFGGVQVLVIGDMYQLPPVTVDEEWNLLSQLYSSPYFFDSRIMQQAPPVYVEFEKIYRQSDDRFIDLLNQVRNNALTNQGNEILQSLHQPDFRVNKEDGYIILTTHNYKADTINGEELAKLKTKSFSFKATIEGEFSEKAYPADEMLQLRERAQVMFIKNDKEKIKRYFNGKIGTITRITDDGIFVQCKDQVDEIEVQKEKWENIRYSLNKTTNQLEENIVGSFTQYPLRLAWAITIHKSQGLTFQKAVIDAGKAFAAGQVYVALSRCTSLEGIVLLSEITPNSLRSDETIVHFSRNYASAIQLKDQLQESKKHYQQKLLLDLFDLMQIIRACSELRKVVQDNAKDFNEPTLPWIDDAEKKLISLQDVAEKFKAHLNHFFGEQATPEENTALQKRTQDASGYFVNALNELLQFIVKSPAVTDSKMQAKNYNEALKDVFTLIAEKKHLLQGFMSGFSIENYYKQKKDFVLPSFTVNAYATASGVAPKIETPHPELHYQLRQLRNKICENKNLAVYMVANTNTIDEMAIYLPQTKDELLKIAGFGRAKVQQYGERFLEIINAYCEEHELTSTITEKIPKKEKKPKAENKPDTKSVSYQLYKEGKTITEIAAERNFAVSTIEGHLSFYVAKGLISIDELVSSEKLVLITPHLNDFEGGSIIPLMQKIDNKLSYSEVRLALAAKEWETANKTLQNNEPKVQVSDTTKAQ